jgi:hypothetical protein
MELSTRDGDAISGAMRPEVCGAGHGLRYVSHVRWSPAEARQARLEPPAYDKG